MLRNAATLGGEAVHAAHDSEVVAALLALNAVFVVASRQGTVESPATRFLRSHAEDLTGGGLVTQVLIPGRPEGAAIERLAVVPSAPPLVAVAVALSLVGGKCSRAHRGDRAARAARARHRGRGPPRTDARFGRRPAGQRAARGPRAPSANDAHADRLSRQAARVLALRCAAPP
jgi:CO/xanthine dehydrogenase FAD-binding subunit